MGGNRSSTTAQVRLKQFLKSCTPAKLRKSFFTVLKCNLKDGNLGIQNGISSCQMIILIHIFQLLLGLVVILPGQLPSLPPDPAAPPTILRLI